MQDTAFKTSATTGWYKNECKNAKTFVFEYYLVHEGEAPEVSWLEAEKARIESFFSESYVTFEQRIISKTINFIP